MQALKEADYLLRPESCLRLMEQLPNDMSLIIFSDEATFKTDGCVNTSVAPDSSFTIRLPDSKKPDS